MHCQSSIDHLFMMHSCHGYLAPMAIYTYLCIGTLRWRVTISTGAIAWSIYITTITTRRKMFNWNSHSTITGMGTTIFYINVIPIWCNYTKFIISSIISWGPGWVDRSNHFDRSTHPGPHDQIFSKEPFNIT